MKSYETAAMSVVLLALMIQSPIISLTVPSNSVTISVEPSTVNAGYSLIVSGRATVASGNVTGTSVAIRVAAPNGTTVGSASAPVAGKGNSGIYYQNLTTGPRWPPGTYAVNATYAVNGASVSNSTTFTLDG